VLKQWWFNASVSMKLHARKRLTSVKGLETTIYQQQEEMSNLQLQLLETRKALVAEKQMREMLAQDMKRSFMRGVCALNLEAMQVRSKRTRPR
jgi:centrosomal protein POC5